MKRLITLSAILALFAGFSIAPAKDHEHKDREHKKEGEHKKKTESREKEDEDEDEDDDDDDGGGKHHQKQEGDRQSADTNGGQATQKKNGPDSLPPPSAQQSVTFAKDIAPLFEDSCTRCHGEDKQKAKLRVDTLDGVMKGTEDGAIVIPGNSAKSPLVLSVARVDKETAMPPDRKPGKDVGPDGKKLPPVTHFTPEQVGLIRAWIDQGAK